jgi:Ni/Co efflux regulator RcnB
MRRIVLTAVLVLSCAFAMAQNAPDSSSNPQSAPQQTAPSTTGNQPAQGQGFGQGRRGMGVGGTVTAINGNTLTIKQQDGTTAQVQVSDNTRYRKDRQEAKLADFKVGDMVMVRGEQKDGVWQAAMLAARPTGGMAGGGANFREGMGKQFIVGEVKAINGTQLTILRPDGVSQDITVDESTSFRKDGQDITLPDVKVGDHVFGRGELKNNVFVPSTLNVGQMRMQRGGPPQGGQPQ